MMPVVTDMRSESGHQGFRGVASGEAGLAGTGSTYKDIPKLGSALPSFRAVRAAGRLALAVQSAAHPQRHAAWPAA